MSEVKSIESGFQKPAIYKIKVLGNLNKSWSEKLRGMQITMVPDHDQNPTTVLVGQIIDQSALSGLLNTLYENHFTIISVKMLK